MMPTPPDIRPRTRLANGAAFARTPSAPRAEELEEWRRGVSALTTFPGDTILQLTEGIADLRAAAIARRRTGRERLERLRWWPEAAIDGDIGARTGARVVAALSDAAPEPMLLGRIAPEGHTILYGTGGAGKGTLTSWWAKQLAQGEHRILIVDYENHPDEWARRLSGLGAGTASSRILHVAPHAAAWTLRRGPIWRHADDLAELAAGWEATLIFIDSIVPACGATDALKPEAAGQYAAALERIGLPVLSLAHVTKGGPLTYPFGSVFWHNLARTTWSLQIDGTRALLTHRKSNNHARVGRFVVETTWQDERPVEVWERPYAAVLADRIGDVLVDGPPAVDRIVSALNAELVEDEVAVKVDSVRAALRRGTKGVYRRFELDAGMWRIATGAPDAVA